MKRLFLVGAAVIATCALTPAAHANVLSTDLVNTGADANATAQSVPAGSMSTLNPIISRIPLLSGPDQRHSCVISDQVDKSWCFYVTIP